MFDPAKCHYSDSLRKTFMKINPHHVSCQYKSVFEDNALAVLLELDNALTNARGRPGKPANLSPCYTGVGSFALTATKSAEQISRSEEEITAIATYVPQVHLSTDSVVDRPSLSWEGPRDGAPCSPVGEAWSHHDGPLRAKPDHEASHPADLIDILFGSIFLEVPRDKPKRELSEFSPWTTCEFRHVDLLDHRLLNPAFVLSKDPPRRSRPRSMPATRTGGGGKCDGSNNINTIFKYLNWKPNETSRSNHNKIKTSPSKPPDNLTSPLRESRSWLREKSALSPSPRPQKDAAQIADRFEHARSRRYYMRHYRRQYTDHLLYPNGDVPQDVIGEYPSIPKINVHCDDVREGAVLKVSHFDFKVNSRFRTASHVGLRHKALQSGTTSGVCRASAESASVYDRLKAGAGAGAGAAAAGGSGTAPTPCPASPVVCRSRPSIPSNARGIICASAVETPVHAVNYSAKGPLHTSTSDSIECQRRTTTRRLGGNILGHTRLK